MRPERSVYWNTWRRTFLGPRRANRGKAPGSRSDCFAVSVPIYGITAFYTHGNVEYSTRQELVQEPRRFTSTKVIIDIAGGTVEMVAELSGEHQCEQLSVDHCAHYQVKRVLNRREAVDEDVSDPLRCVQPLLKGHALAHCSIANCVPPCDSIGDVETPDEQADALYSNHRRMETMDDFERREPEGRHRRGCEEARRQHDQKSFHQHVRVIRLSIALVLSGRVSCTAF